MAKTIQVTVDVDDKQFKEFMTNFNNLSGNIKELLGHFKDIKSAIDQTAKSVKSQANEVKGFIDQLTLAYTKANKITTAIGKWATMINSIGVMLTSGAGLFGLDRLTQSVIQQRKRSLMVGGDQGETQAAIRAAGIISDDPDAELKRVTVAMSGGKGVAGLQNLGLYGTKLSPQETMIEIHKRIQEQLSHIPRERQIPFAEQRGWFNLISPEEALRLGGPGGAEAVREEQEQFANRPKAMSPEAQKAFSDLWQAMVNLKDNVINRLAELLTPFAKWMKTFLETITKGQWASVAKQLLEGYINIKKWEFSLVTWLAKETIKKALEKLGLQLKDITGPLETFKGYMDALNTKFGELITKIGDLVRSWFWTAVTKIFGGGGGGDTATGGGGESWKRGNVPPGSPPPQTAQTTPQTPPATSPKATLGTPAFPAVPFSGLSGGFGGMPALTAGGGPATFGQRFAGSPGTQLGPSFASTITNYGKMQPSAPPSTGESWQRGNVPPGSVPQKTSWNDAVRGAAPGKSGGVIASLASFASTWNQNNQFAMGGGQGRGPLDFDNWQSTRTATLRIDNVAGAGFSRIATAMS